MERAIESSEIPGIGLSLEDEAEAAGDYATRESALEAISLAASNDIKSGHGVTIRIDPAPPNAPASGRQP